MRRRPAAPGWASALALLLAACLAGAVHADDPARIRAARHQLESGRALLAEGRLGAAERELRRGLEIAPDDARLHRALARVLEAAGRPEDAAAARERADALDPPAPALPAAPLASGAGRALWIVPPGREAEVPADLPPEALAETLAARVRTRLPGIALETGDAGRLAEGRTRLDGTRAGLALSVRLERVFCGDTVKDGRFGVARLRVAAARPDTPLLGPRSVQTVVDAPRAPMGCARESVARALEDALALPAIREALAAAPPSAPPGAWSRESVRALFPGIGTTVLGLLRRGRALLASGQLEEAAAAFDAAVEADPGDDHAQAFRHEARRALAMTREIDGGAEGGDLEPRLSAAQRAAAEQALAEERSRRRELETALAVLDEDVHLPSPEALAGLRPAEIREPDAFGPRLARERAGGPVGARAAYAPDGSVIARYFAPSAGGPPVVREEDTDRDGRADRWVVYRGRARHEIFEDGDGRGRPDSHFVFAPGGEPLERVELGLDASGRPRHVLLYRDGQMIAEHTDTDGDGTLDRFDRLDDRGQVDLREEDLDGDGDVDVRSVFRSGKLLRREIEDPARVPDADTAPVPDVRPAARPATPE